MARAICPASKLGTIAFSFLLLKQSFHLMAPGTNAAGLSPDYYN
jgi:hypothetical protein